MKGRLVTFALASIAAASSIGCSAPEAPARDQWEITLSTDAPVPQFGDRIIVEVFTDGSEPCNGCRRELDGSSGSFWPITFGVTPTDGDVEPRVRVRLYRTADTGPDGPNSDRIIDALVQLPAAHGVTKISVPLEMACFGVTASVAAGTSCDADTQASAPIKVASKVDDSTLKKAGSWGPAASVPCAVSPPDAHMVCVPGGAFLLGSPTYLPSGGGFDPTPEQLVRLDPFLLDDHEITIGEARPFFASLGMPAVGEGCTFGATGSIDALPINCVTHAYAAAICHALGKRLPHEAEWEWAAGNRERETPFPWVDGVTDACFDAVVGRADASDDTMSDSCRTSPEDPTGTVAGGNPRDATALSIMNMGGNVSEFTDDAFAPYTDETCWGQAVRLHENPTCATGIGIATRGGSWSVIPNDAHSYERNGLAEGGSANVGFRCAR